MYFLVRGELEVLPSLESSTRIATLGVGEFVGEAALVDAQPRVCFVRAATTVKLLELSREALRTTCEEHPGVAGLVEGRQAAVVAERRAGREAAVGSR